MLRHGDSGRSLGSDGDGGPKGTEKPLPPPVLVYHESARGIVFRDHVRRAHTSMSTSVDGEPSGIARNGSGEMGGEENAKVGEPPVVLVANYTPEIDPLPGLDLGVNDQFQELSAQPPAPAFPPSSSLSEAEQQVVDLLHDQRAVVKTVKNGDWTAFLRRFRVPWASRERRCQQHLDQPPLTSDQPSDHVFNSFVTSTSLLPSGARKMRCYGSSREYTTGVVFALPATPADAEDAQAAESLTWCWPSGYAAKTEFNIDDRGHLINGREEALVSMSQLRRNNHSYLYEADYELAGRMVRGGLSAVPYNEVYLRVGGLGRIVNARDSASRHHYHQDPRSYHTGVGLPIALFVRTACYGHLISLLRTRARMASVLGKDHVAAIPLLYITPDDGVRVLTESLQTRLLQIVSRDLNPFQNPALRHKTEWENASESHLQEKYQELIDLDSDNVRQVLTEQECARLAGGFGATDDSVAHLLMDALQSDERPNDSDNNYEKTSSHKLQDIVNEALAAAVRASDYNTARQLLILYSLVAARGQIHPEQQNDDTPPMGDHRSGERPWTGSEGQDGVLVVEATEGDKSVVHRIPSRPPPPPLDTDRLRSATNSDGLLAVLGAAQTLRAMQDGGARRRVEEAVSALDEWVTNGEQSVVFRLASWREQRAAQDDLQIATEHESNFMAFISNKAISNRKKFATQLRDTSTSNEWEGLVFLRSLHSIIKTLHSPCLRLELLQYILGLDNRYSVAHVARSVELAATCMMITQEEPLLQN